MPSFHEFVENAPSADLTDGTAKFVMLNTDGTTAEATFSAVEAALSIASGLTDVTVPDDITATGTPSDGTFLRGDGVWATPAGAGLVDSVDTLTGAVDLTDRYAAGTSTAPVSPFLYQMWKQTSTGRVFYWDGDFWVQIAGAPPAFTPSDYGVSEFSGFVSPAQGGFGFSIDPVDGDPEGALEGLGGALASHGHRIDFVEVTATTYTLSPSDEGKVLLFNITGNATCTVTLPNQATQSGWQEGMVIGLLQYSSGAITIDAATDVIVDGNTAAANFTLVQHSMSSLTRMIANNYWNFSGQVGA